MVTGLLPLRMCTTTRLEMKFTLFMTVSDASFSTSCVPPLKRSFTQTLWQQRYRRLWDSEEDEKLIELKRQKKSELEISAAMPYRTLAASKNRWTFLRKRLGKPLLGPHPPWDAEDDERLLSLRTEGRSYQEIKDHFPSRTVAGLVDRFNRFLQPRTSVKDCSASTRRLKWNIGDTEKLVRMREREGRSYADIAKSFPGRTMCAVQHRYLEHTESEDRPKLRNYRGFTADEDKRIFDLKRQGLTWKQMTDHFVDRTGNSICRRFHRIAEGVQKRVQLRHTNELDEKVAQLRREGKTWREIATSIPDRSAKGLIMRYYKLRKKTCSKD